MDSPVITRRARTLPRTPFYRHCEPSRLPGRRAAHTFTPKPGFYRSLSTRCGCIAGGATSYALCHSLPCTKSDRRRTRVNWWASALLRCNLPGMAWRVQPQTLLRLLLNAMPFGTRWHNSRLLSACVCSYLSLEGYPHARSPGCCIYVRTPYARGL